MRQGTPGGYLMRKQREGQRIPVKAAYLGQGYSRVLDRGHANLRELRQREVRRITLPRTPVNGATRRRAEAATPRLFSPNRCAFGVAPNSPPTRRVLTRANYRRWRSP